LSTRTKDFTTALKAPIKNKYLGLINTLKVEKVVFRQKLRDKVVFHPLVAFLQHFLDLQSFQNNFKQKANDLLRL